uniref:Ig-like domain-containing protein n=1 Tax=Strongyloides papillosus TaxID=174720 RepID=A0A0N5BVP4_STREA
MLFFFLSKQCECKQAVQGLQENATISHGEYDESVWESLKTKVVNIYRDQNDYLRMIGINPCYEFGCLCENTTDTIICENSNFNDLLYSNLTKFDPKKIFLRHVSIYHLNFTSFFEKFPNVRVLSMEHCRIRDFIIENKMFLLKELYMNHNYLSNFDNICLLMEFLPNLRTLSFNFNHFKAIDECSNVIYNNLRNLSLANNKIAYIKNVPAVGLRFLNISSNQISSIPAKIFESRLEYLSISNNLITELPKINTKSLIRFEANNLNIDDLSFVRDSKLEFLSLENSHIYIFNFTRQRLKSLSYLSLLNSPWLTNIEGEAPETLKTLKLSNSLVAKFPDTFFKNTKNINLVLKDSNFSCDECFLKWTKGLVNFDYNDIGCHEIKVHKDCDAIIDNSVLPKTKNITIIREKLGLKKILPCNFAGDSIKKLEWKKVHPETLIGSVDMRNIGNPVTVFKPNHYQILPGGALLLKEISQDMVERYTCTVFSETKNFSSTISFRLDFSQWYSTNIFDSVFWGACFCSLMACLASFLFNVTWIILKNIALWWLNRAERLSRVKGMVDAMERYRQKQVERIQDSYHRNIEAIRENYNAQREQLTMSYSNQMKKFSDYRQQRIENIHEHIEGIREQYNQQIQRIKEFGSKRAEQLCDSYEQQLIRVKTFTLQNRLKLIRQYKVKQKVINKLLERYNDNSADLNEADKEAEIRRVLDLNETDLETNEALLDRSPSYYSLPEFCTDEDISSLRPKNNYTSPNRHILNNQSPLNEQEQNNHKNITSPNKTFKCLDLPGPSGVQVLPPKPNVIDKQTVSSNLSDGSLTASLNSGNSTSSEKNCQQKR